MKIFDPATLLSDDDRKSKTKVKAARAKEWKLPKTKEARKSAQDERIEQYLEENPGATWPESV